MMNPSHWVVVASYGTQEAPGGVVRRPSWPAGPPGWAGITFFTAASEGGDALVGQVAIPEVEMGDVACVRRRQDRGGESGRECSRCPSPHQCTPSGLSGT